MNKLLCGVIAVITLTATVNAEEVGPLGFGDADYAHDMETDRPDFTEGALTVTPGHLQLEGGYGFVYNDEQDVRTREHEVPQLLLRVGLLEDLELRLGWAGYRRTENTATGSEETVAQGGADMSVGIKHHLYDQGEYTPELSFISELRLPTGADSVTSDDVEPELKLIWAYEVSSDFSMAGNVNFSSPVEDDERFFETASSLTLAHSLTELIGAYVEYFGFYPNAEAPDSSSTHYLSGGFTFGLTESLQLDVLAGFGLNSEADDFFSGVGFAVRL